MWRCACLALLAVACGGSQDHGLNPPSWYPVVDSACIERERAKLEAGAVTAPEVHADENREEVHAAPNAIAGKRISGRRNIPPDDETKAELRRSGFTKTCPRYKLCLGKRGAPEKIDVLRESCFPRYDADIMRVMYEWRYSPYTVDGVPVRVCISITLCYNQS